MDFSEILKLLRDHCRLIGASLALAVLFGLAAAIYPIPYVLTLSIPNDEGYFSLPEIKKLKNRLPVEALRVVDKETDPELKKLLLMTVTESKWIEKNITPGLALTKADAKDLIDTKSESDNSIVAWLNVQVTSQDKVRAEQAARWISEILCKLSYKNKFEQYLTHLRDDAEAQEIRIYSELMVTDKNLQKFRETIKLVVEISKKYPQNPDEKATVQLSVPGDGRQDGRQDGREETLSSPIFSQPFDYLSPQKQLSILASQEAQLKNNLLQVDFEKKLQEAKAGAARRELIGYLQRPLDQLFSGRQVIYEFWPLVKLDQVITGDQSEWMVSYAMNMSNSMRALETINVGRFDRQISQLDGLIVEDKFPRKPFVLGFIIFGLILPSLIVFAPSALKKLLSAGSDA